MVRCVTLMPLVGTHGALDVGSGPFPVSLSQPLVGAEGTVATLQTCMGSHMLEPYASRLSADVIELLFTGQ